MKKVLRYSLILCLLLGAKAYAQDRVVSGKVTAADDKLPIPGVIPVPPSIRTTWDEVWKFKKDRE